MSNSPLLYNQPKPRGDWVNEAPEKPISHGGPVPVFRGIFEAVSVSLQLLFRLAAMLLLLVTGAELFACEMLAPEQCESFGLPSDNDEAQLGDNCICCCNHILVVQPVTLMPSHQTVVHLGFLQPASPQIRPTTVYHPPKA